MPLDSPGSRFAERFVLPVRAPYRLDLTVATLRRSSKNVVDVVAPDGAYLRAFDGEAGPGIVAVRQIAPDALALAIDAPPGEAARLRALTVRMLGTERETPHFDRAAEATPWLRVLAARMKGVRPPRYPTLWEAVVNAVSFQQISILAAGAIVRRFIEAFGTPVVPPGGLPGLHAFPGAAAILAAPEAELRATGQSAGKVATLRRVAEALLEGRLDEAMLEERPSLEAIALLGEIKGIGPWTGAVVMMRGLGRLDVFPEKDSGLARSLRVASGSAIGEDDARAVVASLAPEQAMLYFHLLLALLEARGELPALTPDAVPKAAETGAALRRT